MPGPGALASPADEPEGVGNAGLGGEVVELVVEQHAGALGDEAEAEIEVQRVGVGDDVALASTTEKWVVWSPSKGARSPGLMAEDGVALSA